MRHEEDQEYRKQVANQGERNRKRKEMAAGHKAANFHRILLRPPVLA